MKYEDLYDDGGFARNMRRTPWLKLFPHWWSEKDPFLNAIGDEVELLKASALFGLLNIGIKPPVLLWQESLKHEQYNVNQDITRLPETIEIRAPLYKTWGSITLTNHTEDDIHDIKITFNDKDGYLINQLISKDDIIHIDLTEDKVQLNNHTIKPQKIGKGMPYFITSQNNEVYDENTPLHNEIVRLKIDVNTNVDEGNTFNTIPISQYSKDWSKGASDYSLQDGSTLLSLSENNCIGYKLNFNNVKEISFRYKLKIQKTSLDEDVIIPCILNCYADGIKVFSENINNKHFQKHTINIGQLHTFDAYEDNIEDAVTLLSGEGLLEFEVEPILTPEEAKDTTNEEYKEAIVLLDDIKYVEEVKSYCDMNIDINMDNAVFVNEQNIEITGLELIPIEKVELYAKYDFDYNKSVNK